VDEGGIPVTSEEKALAVPAGSVAVLDFSGGEPLVTGAVAYPLEQEGRLIHGPGVRFLAPAEGLSALETKPLRPRREGDKTLLPAELPKGAYVFRVSVQPPGVDADRAWADYGFRVWVG
jgi:hypothetical protein